MPGTRGTYRRVLLKLSGEVFGGEKGIGVDIDVMRDVAKQIKDVVKTGRTHFMDATPLTLGQEFSGYVAQIDNSVRTINNALVAVAELALGGTAVGSCWWFCRSPTCGCLNSFLA